MSRILQGGEGCSALKEDCRHLLRRKLISDGMMYDRTSQFASNCPPVKSFACRLHFLSGKSAFIVSEVRHTHKCCLSTQEINDLILVREALFHDRVEMRCSH